ncbi:MAG: response regulator [Candidatus Sedimenticola sp. 6PFRAG1]
MNERWLQQSVLVVDDERFVLKTTAYILQRLGFTNVLTAETGDAALRHIDSADPPRRPGAERSQHAGDGWRGTAATFRRTGLSG